jgi:glycosyltransferase involved in cell wall biosynthesis
MLMSDSPSQMTGLARITKDIALIAAKQPEFRVASYGRGGLGSIQLPFHQYDFAEERQWGENTLRDVWTDFSRHEPGVLMTVWDPSRLGWLAQPRMGGEMEKWLRARPFKLWGYMPVDSFGPNGRLTGYVKDALQGFDRLLAYTLWGKQVLEDTLGQEVDWLPHGYNPQVFQPYPKAMGRQLLGLPEEVPLVGMVAANQARKDYGVAFQAFVELRRRVPNSHLWLHTDVLERHWSVPALISDFGLHQSVHVTRAGELNNTALAHCYSACDVTMLPSGGEGWGFPITESMACGVPCVHGNYGGGVEQIPDQVCLVDPVAMRLDTMWNSVRPVWNPIDWTDRLQRLLEEPLSSEVFTRAVEHLQWQNLGPSWAKWLKAGLEGGAK